MHALGPIVQGFRQMSVDLLMHVKDYWDSPLGKSDQTSPTERFLLFLLADTTNQKTGKCYPALSRLQRWSGLAQSTLRRARDGLKARGLIDFDSGTGRSSTHYRITLPPRAALADKHEPRSRLADAQADEVPDDASEHPGRPEQAPWVPPIDAQGDGRRHQTDLQLENEQKASEQVRSAEAAAN